MGRSTGIEPAARGSTNLCSTTELRPPSVSCWRRRTYTDLWVKSNKNSLFFLFLLMRIKYLLIGMIVALSSFSQAFAVWNIRVLPGRSLNYTTYQWTKIWHYEVPKITVIKPAAFSIVFNGVGNTASRLVRDGEYAAVLNASYFGRHQDGTYFPAGVWYDNGFLISPQMIPQKDLNLQVLAYYYSGSIDFYENSEIDISSLSHTTPGLYFNAWPWLVKDGTINPDIVRSRSHRQSKAYRTAMLRTETGELYFVIATEKIDLPQLIVFIYKSRFIQKDEKFNLVNLDGGSSTSLWSPIVKFNATKRLPLFIGVK